MCSINMLKLILIQNEIEKKRAICKAPWSLGWAGSRYRVGRFFDDVKTMPMLPAGIATIIDVLGRAIPYHALRREIMDPDQAYDNICKIILEKTHPVPKAIQVIQRIFGYDRKQDTTNTYLDISRIISLPENQVLAIARTISNEQSNVRIGNVMKDALDEYDRANCSRLKYI